MKAYVLISSIFLLSFVSAHSQNQTNSFSIINCLEYAGGNNIQIKVAKYNEQIAHFQTNEVKGRALPQANINGIYEDKLKIPLLIIPGASALRPTGQGAAGNGDAQAIRMGYQFNTSVVGEVTQMLYDPSFGVGLRAAKQSTQLYKQQTQQISEETAYNIAKAYYQVIVLKKRQDLLVSNLATVDKTLKLTELQLENGVAKQVDVNRLKVNANNLQSQLQQSQLGLEQALNLLKFQMGMPLDQGLMLTDTALSFTPEDISWNGSADNFISNRIDYKVLQTNLRLQELDKTNTLRGYYPTLTGFANYGYQAQGPNFALFKTTNNDWVDFRTASIGLRLRIPVFDGLQRNFRTQQSKLKIRQLEENIYLSKQNIQLEISNALTQLQNTQKRIEAEKQNVALAEEVYKVTQLEYREGVSSSLNLVTSEMALREAQNTYIQTLLDYYNAKLDLEKAKGNLLPYLNSK